MARQINAKYAGKCAHCNSAISPGDPIMYEPECKAVWHIECHQDRMTTEKSPVKPVRAGTTARYTAPDSQPNYLKKKRTAQPCEVCGMRSPHVHGMMCDPDECSIPAGMCNHCAGVPNEFSPIEEHIAGDMLREKQQREELIACLKRTYTRIDDAMDLRAPWNPREAHSDIVKTLNAILGEGSWR